MAFTIVFWGVQLACVSSSHVKYVMGDPWWLFVPSRRPTAGRCMGRREGTNWMLRRCGHIIDISINSAMTNIETTRSHNMTRILVAPSNRHVSPNTATSFPKPQPAPSENLKVPKIKNVSKQSDWNTQDEKPPKSHCVLSKEINVHTQQAGAKS